MKAELFPPRSSIAAEGGDDNRTARGLLIELDGGRENMERQRGPDPESGVAVVDSESAKQECGGGIGRAFRHDIGCGGSVDPGQ